MGERIIKSKDQALYNAVIALPPDAASSLCGIYTRIRDTRSKLTHKAILRALPFYALHTGKVRLNWCSIPILFFPYLKEVQL